MQENPFNYNSKREKKKQIKHKGQAFLPQQYKQTNKRKLNDFAKAAFWNGPRVWTAARSSNII